MLKSILSNSLRTSQIRIVSARCSTTVGDQVWTVALPLVFFFIFQNKPQIVMFLQGIEQVGIFLCSALTARLISSSRSSIDLYKAGILFQVIAMIPAAISICVLSYNPDAMPAFVLGLFLAFGAIASSFNQILVKTQLTNEVVHDEYNKLVMNQQIDCGQTIVRMITAFALGGLCFCLNGVKVTAPVVVIIVLTLTFINLLSFTAEYMAIRPLVLQNAQSPKSKGHPSVLLTAAEALLWFTVLYPGPVLSIVLDLRETSSPAVMGIGMIASGIALVIQFCGLRWAQMKMLCDCSLAPIGQGACLLFAFAMLYVGQPYWFLLGVAASRCFMGWYAVTSTAYFRMASQISREIQDSILDGRASDAEKGTDASGKHASLLGRMNGLTHLALALMNVLSSLLLGAGDSEHKRHVQLILVGVSALSVFTSGVIWLYIRSTADHRTIINEIRRTVRVNAES